MGVVSGHIVRCIDLPLIEEHLKIAMDAPLKLLHEYLLSEFVVIWSHTFNWSPTVEICFLLAEELLKAQFHGPYEVARKIIDLNYVVNTPNRNKATQMCHINMFKPYYERETLNLS